MNEESKVMADAATRPAYEWERLFDIRNRDQVKRFVKRYPFLADILNDAFTRIQNYFPGAPVSLEAVTDPEADDVEGLVASIGTSLRGSAAHETIKRFDDDWWLEAGRRAQGRLCIKLEFR